VNGKVVWVLEGVRVKNARQPVKRKGTLQVLVRDTKQTNIKEKIKIHKGKLIGQLVK